MEFSDFSRNQSPTESGCVSLYFINNELFTFKGEESEMKVNKSRLMGQSITALYCRLSRDDESK